MASSLDIAPGSHLIMCMDDKSSTVVVAAKERM